MVFKNRCILVLKCMKIGLALERLIFDNFLPRAYFKKYVKKKCYLELFLYNFSSKNLFGVSSTTKLFSKVSEIKLSLFSRGTYLNFSRIYLSTSLPFTLWFLISAKR